MSKMQVKPISSSELTHWELHLLEKETGLILAEYAPSEPGGPSKPAPMALMLGMLWLAARRTGATDITLEQAANNFEFMPAAGDDPKDGPEEPDATATGGH